MIAARAPVSLLVAIRVDTIAHGGPLADSALPSSLAPLSSTRSATEGTRAGPRTARARTLVLRPPRRSRRRRALGPRARRPAPPLVARLNSTASTAAAPADRARRTHRRDRQATATTRSSSSRTCGRRTKISRHMRLVIRAGHRTTDLHRRRKVIHRDGADRACFSPSHIFNHVNLPHSDISSVIYPLIYQRQRCTLHSAALAAPCAMCTHNGKRSPAELPASVAPAHPTSVFSAGLVLLWLQLYETNRYETQHPLSLPSLFCFCLSISISACLRLLDSPTSRLRLCLCLTRSHSAFPYPIKADRAAAHLTAPLTSTTLASPHHTLHNLLCPLSASYLSISLCYC